MMCYHEINKKTYINIRFLVRRRKVQKKVKLQFHNLH